MNLMDLLTGGGDPNRPSLLGLLGKLPTILTPGSEGPIAAPGQSDLSPSDLAAAQSMYKQQFRANQAAAVASGSPQQAVGYEAGAPAQNQYNATVQRALQSAQMIKQMRDDDARRASLAALIKNPSFTPEQQAALSAATPEQASGEALTQVFKPAEKPMEAGQYGIWVQDPNSPNGWTHIDNPSTNGVPKDAKWDEKRAGFAWIDAAGSHFQKVPGLSPDMGEENKPQKIPVHLPDGRLQDMWVAPGKTADTGIPVGVPYDATSGTGGSRARAMMGRIILGGNQVAHSAENIMSVPVTSNTGFLGTGGNHNSSLLGITIDNANNTIAGQDAQTYKVLQAGLSRNLAAIEAAGLAPPGSLTGSMDSVVFKPGDTQITKLNKLADIRQIAEVGMESVLASPDVSPQQKVLIQGIIDRIQKAIPFTQAQVLKFQYSNKKGYTMKDAMKEIPSSDSQVDTSAPPPT
jgi:hypothetical protein